MRFKRLMMIFPMMLVDAIVLLLSGWLACAFMYEGQLIAENMVLFIRYFPILLGSSYVIFYFLGMYAGLWQFAGIRDVLFTLLGSGITTAIYYFGSHFWLSEMGLSQQFYLTFFAIMAVFLINARMYSRYKSLFLKLIYAFNKKGHRILLIGAGEAAHIILSEISTSKLYSHSNVVGVIDDDPMKRGLRIHGYKILGDRNCILAMAEKYAVDTIIIAIPSCSEKDRKEIIEICQRTGCELKVTPMLQELPENFNINSLRNVEIEDLLGRKPIRTDLSDIMSYVSGKRVMVTGGGGSIGSELCRQIAAYRPKELLLFDIYENTTYEVQLELQKNFPDLKLSVRIGSICDEQPLESLLDEFKPHIIYHAAAHKHVPLMEDSPAESIRNNVFGTLNLVRAADKCGVERFVMISTDKAVNPTNVMGATKRMCEMIVQSYAKTSKTEFVAVRFGNVLGSHGSVIPLFRRQLKEGGPLTVTHRDIIRYFMTISEAVSLVLQAGALAKGGEIFVLDMGEPVKIVTLAENLIRLSGLEPYKDVDIEFTGLRPGEKLFEEMLMDEEGLSSTKNELIHIGKPIEMDSDVFFKQLDALQAKLGEKNADLRAEIKQIVPTYNPTEL